MTQEPSSWWQLPFTPALIGLGGVLIGTALTLWGQSRARHVEYLNVLRNVYADWVSAHLSLHRWEQRAADLVQKEPELRALREQLRELRGDERRAPPEQQEFLRARGVELDATIHSIAHQLGETSRRMEEAQLACEASYGRVMLFEHNRKRIDKLAAVQEAKAPYVIASELGAADGLIDPKVVDREWRTLAEQRGVVLRYVEGTLRVERYSLPFRVMRFFFFVLPLRLWRVLRRRPSSGDAGRTGPQAGFS